MEIYSNEPKLDQKLVASPIATDKEDSVIVKDHEQSVVIHGNTTTTTIKISDTQFNQPMQKEPISTATIHDATDNHYIILKDDNDSITEAQSIILKDENNNVNLDTDNENASAPEVKKKRGRPKREGPALTPQQKEERKRKKIADAIIELMQMEDIELYNDEEGTYTYIFTFSIIVSFKLLTFTIEYFFFT